jgi:hypothetical protein
MNNEKHNGMAPIKKSEPAVSQVPVQISHFYKQNKIFELSM